MKKQILLTMLSLFLAMTLLSFQQPAIEGNALVEKINGVDVYVNSIPLREYEVVKSGITNVVMGQCNGMISRSAKKAAEEKADGVIIHLENYKYEAINYK